MLVKNIYSSPTDLQYTLYEKKEQHYDNIQRELPVLVLKSLKFSGKTISREFS